MGYFLSFSYPGVSCWTKQVSSSLFKEHLPWPSGELPHGSGLFWLHNPWYLAEKPLSLYPVFLLVPDTCLTSPEVLGAAVMVTHQWKLNHPCQCGLCPHHLFNSQLKFPSMIKQTKDVNVYHCFSPLVMSSQWQHKLIPSICFVFHMTFFLLFHKNSKLIRYLRGSLITQ